MADPLPQLDDQALVRLYQRDANEGLMAVLQRYGGKARNYLRKQYDPLLDDHQREQAVLDAALKVMETFDPSRGKPLGGWLIFLADREAINLLRREERHYRNRVAMPLSDDARFGAGDENRAEIREFVEHLEEVLQSRLSELERKVIQADMDAGKAANAGELAERFETDARSIYAARVRARRKLAEWLHGTVSC